MHGMRSGSFGSSLVLVKASLKLLHYDKMARLFTGKGSASKRLRELLTVKNCHAFLTCTMTSGISENGLTGRGNRIKLRRLVPITSARLMDGTVSISRQKELTHFIRVGLH